jgi:cytochrome o ubiquinol oxidase subunit 2
MHGDASVNRVRLMRNPESVHRDRRGLRAVATGLAVFALGGCRVALMDPKGPVAAQEKSLIITATLLMLIVVIPVIVMTLAFAWRYRASNREATYRPNWSYSHRIEVAVWSVPVAIIAVLGVLTWKTTHELDPYKPLESSVKPIEVQVVALDWKWLFIYPEQHIATVNEIQFPAGTPVNFKITSDTVMNVFFIPQLGSQIYAMAGMQTQVHLIADQPGTYDGLSANFSGAGFPDMKFKATATSQAGFDAWVAKVKASGNKLGLDNYADLAKPSSKAPVKYFSFVEPVLFAAVLDKTMDKSSGLKLADKICLPTRVVSVAGEKRAE